MKKYLTLYIITGVLFVILMITGLVYLIEDTNWFSIVLWGASAVMFKINGYFAKKSVKD